jgi:hypothetical protein
MNRAINIKKLLIFSLLFITGGLNNEISAKRSSFNYIKKTTPKSAYEGFGRPSKANGRIKTKSTHGYFKPSNGYKYINPYSRSK